MNVTQLFARGTRVSIARGRRTSYGRLIAPRAQEGSRPTDWHLVVHVDGDDAMPLLGEACRLELGSDRGLASFDGTVREVVGRMISVAPAGEISFTQRRSAVRAEVQITATLRTSSGHVTAQVADVSLAGVRLRHPCSVEEQGVDLAELARSGRGELVLALADGPFAAEVIIVGAFPAPASGAARVSPGTDIRMQWDGLSGRQERRLARVINDALRCGYGEVDGDNVLLTTA